MEYWRIRDASDPSRLEDYICNMSSILQ